MKSRELTNKGLADLIGTTPTKLSKLLRGLGMATLVDEAQRMQCRQAWNENRLADETVTVENIRQAFNNLSQDLD